MLPNSTIYTFIHSSSQFTIHFFEAQKLIHDMVVSGNFSNESFPFIRNMILATQPIYSTTNPRDAQSFQLENSKFNFKIETNFKGHVRTALLLDEETPNSRKIEAACKFQRIHCNQTPPKLYKSNLKDISIYELIRSICKNVYQTEVRLTISEESDQSFLILKSPITTNFPKFEIDKNIPLDRIWMSQFDDINKILNKGYTNSIDIIGVFEKLDFKFVSTQEIDIQCSCSQEKMRQYIKSMEEKDPNSLFQDDNSLDIQCQFCQNKYIVSREDIK